MSLDLKVESVMLVYADIDGLKNGGEFLEKRIGVTFSEADLKDGWYVKIGVDVQLTQKE